MFRNSTAYGDKINSYDACKLVALLAMIADHLGEYFWPELEWLRVIGRMAFPLFLFLVGTSGNWKIKTDFLVLAVMTVFCAAFTHHPVFPLNILVTIAVTRYAMRWITQRQMTPQYLRGIFVVSLAWFPLFAWCDYSTFAFLFAMSGYLHRQKPEAPETRMFLYATLALHFLLTARYAFYFHRDSMLLLLPVAVFTAYFLRTFRLYDLADDFLPHGLRRILQWIARNTLPVYALHVMVFMVVERFYFPERLANFQWL